MDYLKNRWSRRSSSRRTQTIGKHNKLKFGTLAEQGATLADERAYEAGAEKIKG